MLQNGKDHLEYRIISEIWDGKIWVEIPSGPMESLDQVRETVAKINQPRKLNPEVGDYGRSYYQQRSISKWKVPYQ